MAFRIRERDERSVKANARIDFAQRIGQVQRHLNQRDEAVTLQ